MVLDAAASWSPQPWRAEWLTLLEERHGTAGRRREPVAEVALAPMVIVGRGGLEVAAHRRPLGRPLKPPTPSVRPTPTPMRTPRTVRTGPAEARPLVVVARREGTGGGGLDRVDWGPDHRDHPRSAGSGRGPARGGRPPAVGVRVGRDPAPGRPGGLSLSRRPIRRPEPASGSELESGPRRVSQDRLDELGDDALVLGVVGVGAPAVGVVEVGLGRGVPVAFGQPGVDATS